MCPGMSVAWIVLSAAGSWEAEVVVTWRAWLTVAWSRSWTASVPVLSFAL